MEMQMELSYVFAVVITGLVVVFLGLVLLIAFISLIGAFFKKADQNKKPLSLKKAMQLLPRKQRLPLSSRFRRQMTMKLSRSFPRQSQ